MKTQFLCFFTAFAFASNVHAITDNSEIHAPWEVACQVWVEGSGWTLETIDQNDPQTQEMFREVHSTDLNLIGLNRAMCLGRNYTARPDSAQVRANLKPQAPIGLIGITFDFGLIDSPDILPSRDAFSISFDNAENNLFNVSFTPAAQTTTPSLDNAMWNISYQAADEPSVSLGEAISESELYSFDLSFSPNGTSTDFRLAIGGDNHWTWSGNIAVDPSSVATDFNWIWTPTLGPSGAGGNYFVMDNLNLIPEPSTSLLLGLGGLALVFHPHRRK